MRLSEKQSDFLWMVHDLLMYTKEVLTDEDIEDGLYIKIVEWNRTIEQQKYYVSIGTSKTMDSKHLKGLAVDFALLKEGKFIKNHIVYTLMGMYWESIGGTWGGRWRTLKDYYHFEYNSNKRQEFLNGSRR